MKNRFTCLVAAISIALPGCLSDETKDIQGKWTIDMNTMLERAQSMGASPRDLQSLRETYDGARMHVTDRKLILSIQGEKDTMDVPYKHVSSTNGCHRLNLALEGKESPTQYCVRNGLLEVEDLASRRAVEIYRRAS
jgi:hypothetical protein